MQFEFPIKMPRITTEKFDRLKADYNAKHGYTIHIPGFSDIFKLNIPKPPTKDEVKQYRKKDIAALGVFRYEQIKELMKKKKESYLRMLASPTPKWINNIGSGMTFLDDINDSLGTLGVVTRSLAHLLPKTAAKILMGPAGWALTAADVVGLAMAIARAPINAIQSKSNLNETLAENPFCKEAKARRAKRLKRIIPSKGEFIELFQTTNNIWGVGLSLGPILGAFIEAFTGPYRVLTGHKVTVDWPVPEVNSVESSAISGMLAAFHLEQAGPEITSEDQLKSYLVTEMATHVLYPYFDQYHLLDHVKDLQHVIPKAPKVKDPLTKLLFDEAGVDPDTLTGLPAAVNTDGSVVEMMNAVPSWGRGFNKGFAIKEKNSMLGQLGAQAVNNASINLIALLEGEDQIETAAHPVLSACFKIIEHGYMMAKPTTKTNYACFAKLAEDPNVGAGDPSFEMIRDLICPLCGIPFIPRTAFMLGWGRDPYSAQQWIEDKWLEIGQQGDWFDLAV